MVNPPGYQSLEQNTINNDINQNNVRLPSYSSIDLEDIEISVKIDKYDLKKKINNIKLFGYVVFVLNSLYFIFSMLIDNIQPENNTTVVKNYNINDDTHNKFIFNGLLYTLFTSICCSNIIQSLIYYNFEFSYIEIENKNKYKNYKILFTSIYYFKYIMTAIFILVLLYNYHYIISNNNINIVDITMVNYFLNEIVDKFIILNDRDLLLILK